MKSPLAVIAIGGNSLIKDDKKMTVLDQYQAAGETSHHIAALVAAGYRVVVTHGNGPQVGFILLRSDLAKNVLHQVPLESCVADTQGAIGYQVGQTLANELRRQKIDKPIATVVTQVLVDKNDQGFTNPTSRSAPSTPRRRPRSTPPKTAGTSRRMPAAAGAALSPRPSRSGSSKRIPSACCWRTT